MALVEGCKHSLDISVPVDTVENETERVVNSFQQRAKLPGFRPGKAPAGLIRKQFEGDIRQQVLENLPTISRNLVDVARTSPYFNPMGLNTDPLALSVASARESLGARQ